MRSGGRVVEGARLESEYTPKALLRDGEAVGDVQEYFGVAHLCPADVAVEAGDGHAIVFSVEAGRVLGAGGDESVDFVSVLVGVDDGQGEAALLLDLRAAGGGDPFYKGGDLLLRTGDRAFEPGLDH